jgi:hypothetical protein
MEGPNVEWLDKLPVKRIGSSRASDPRAHLRGCYRAVDADSISPDYHHRGQKRLSKFNQSSRSPVALIKAIVPNGRVTPNVSAACSVLFLGWRDLPDAHAAALDLGLVALDLIVLAQAGSSDGGFYMPCHELLPLFKKGTASHVANIVSGRRGRQRTNMWAAAPKPSAAAAGPLDHSVGRSTALLVEALNELTNPGDVVFDPFLALARPSLQRKSSIGSAAVSSLIRAMSTLLSAATRQRRAPQPSSPIPAKRLNGSSPTGADTVIDKRRKVFDSLALFRNIIINMDICKISAD